MLERRPVSLEMYRKRRRPMAHDRTVDCEAAEHAWQRGVRRALLLTLIVLLLLMPLVSVLPLVLLSR